MSLCCKLLFMDTFVIFIPKCIHFYQSGIIIPLECYDSSLRPRPYMSCICPLAASLLGRGYTWLYYLTSARAKVLKCCAPSVLMLNGKPLSFIIMCHLLSDTFCRCLHSVLQVLFIFSIFVKILISIRCIVRLERQAHFTCNTNMAICWQVQCTNSESKATLGGGVMLTSMINVKRKLKPSGR